MESRDAAAERGGARRCRAVLFDLDGTLLDTIGDIAAAMNRVLARFGLPGRPTEEYKLLVGEGMEVLVSRSLPKNRRDARTIARGVASLAGEYNRDRWKMTKPYPGIPRLLDFLAGNGYRMAILSNKPDDSTRAVAADLLSRWRFDRITGARRSAPLKPDPAAALAIAREMAIPPFAFIYVGDTGVDMQTARAAGMLPAGALWGFRNGDELTANGAQLLLREPEELIVFLQKNSEVIKTADSRGY